MYEQNGMNDDFSLFAVFVSRLAKNKVLRLIKLNYEVKNDKVFILEDLENSETYILTFNGIKKANLIDDVPEVRNVIRVHRSKINNTIYTINSLNALVMSLNNGNLDHNFKIDWENPKYYNKFITTKDEELRFIPTKLKTVIRLDHLVDEQNQYSEPNPSDR